MTSSNDWRDEVNGLVTFLNRAPINLDHPSFPPIQNSRPNPYVALGQIYRAFRVYPELHDSQFHAWGNLELVKLQFESRTQIVWTPSMFRELLQDRYAKTVHWFMKYHSLPLYQCTVDIAFKNEAHSVIRILLGFGLSHNGTVAPWIKTTACYEYLIRTENLNALQRLLRATNEFLGPRILEVCLEDLNHISTFRPPYQCRKSIRLKLYADLIRGRRYHDTWPWTTILTVNELTDQERLDLLRVSHDNGLQLPYVRDDIIIISFLLSRRQVPEYMDYLVIFMYLGFKFDATHHDIYEDYLQVLLSRKQCDNDLWYSLLKLPTDRAIRCLDQVLDAQVNLPPSRRFNLKFGPVEIDDYLEYLEQPLAYPILTHLFKRRRINIWILAQYCLNQPMTADSRKFLRSLGVSITIPELLAEKYCTDWADVFMFQHDLRKKDIDFLLTVTSMEQTQMEIWIEQQRKDLGDLDDLNPNLILNLSTIRTNELIRFRGFNQTTNQMIEMILPVRRSRLNRVDLAYGITVVAQPSSLNQPKNAWITQICQHPQPTYGLKVRGNIPLNEMTNIRLFRIPRPSLRELCVVAVRRRYHRNDNPIIALPMELRDMIHPKWLTWAN